ncbi:MAG TPA: hypothetical protein VMU89_07695 [Thermomicrobiaceae bacterium]|nr:hypothetical protein [Thermomicrobiaceae bacterium]
MSSLELALILDSQDRPVEAAEAYRAAVEDGTADLETHINYAVLMFVCNDGGYAAHHHLSRTFMAKTWSGMFETLEAAQRRWGWRAEVEFWKRYFRFIILGETLTYAYCKTLTQETSSFEPYLYLYAFTPEGHREYESEARVLLSRVSSGSTARERYVRSVLESALRIDEVAPPPDPVGDG